MNTNKIILTITLIIFFLPVHSQLDSSYNLNSNFTALLVDDLDASLDWYRTVLGFDVVSRTDSEERGFSQANLIRGDERLELVTLMNIKSLSELLGRPADDVLLNGIFKFGFAVDDFDRWAMHFRKQNVAFRGEVVEDPQSGKRMVVLLDPGGNRVQIFER